MNQEKGDSSELRAEISQRIEKALTGAGTIKEAKRLVGRMSSGFGQIDLTLKGICAFSTEEEFKLAMEEAEKILPGLFPVEDFNHEISHFEVGKKYGCDTKLALVIGLDGKSLEDNYLSWDAYWCKAVASIFKPEGLDDDKWNEILLEFYDAPETASRQDSHMLDIHSKKRK